MRTANLENSRGESGTPVRLKIKPRGKRRTAHSALRDSHPPSAEDILARGLPTEVLKATGEPHRFNLLRRGPSGLQLRIGAEKGEFVLKIVRGPLRMVELRTEHKAIEDLRLSPIPVPKPTLFFEWGDLAFYLREFVDGDSLCTLLGSCRASTRNAAVDRSAEMLRRIHGFRVADWSWEQWLDANLILAEKIMEADALDPEEFSETDPPNMVLEWLNTSKPSPGEVTLIHGAYCPRNIWCRDNRIVAVINWSMIDYGDPWYDLASILHHMPGTEERNRFLSVYGVNRLEEKRMLYFCQLARFLNV
jgi:aminoglycoside phosphotransferase (APT) family kinase protein